MKNVNPLWRVSGLIALLLVFASFALAGDRSSPGHPWDVTSQKKKDIRRLMVLTGSGDLGVQATTQMMTSLKSAFPDLPQEFWDEFKKEVKSETLIDLCIPIYDKHFSHADIKELIAFYESPLGKRMTKAMPVVLQESMAAGQQWGQEIGQRAVKRMREKGYKVN